MEKLFHNFILGGLSPVLSAEGAVRSGVGGMSLILAGSGILAFLLIFLVLLISLRRKHRLNMFWAFLAVLFAGGSMLLCLLGSAAGTLVAKPSGDPQETVTAFFDALCSRDYEAAYACLSGYTDLGLSGAPADSVGQAMYRALQESYSYELYGSCTTDQLTAHQEVLFTYLNLPSIAPDVEEETAAVLAGFVEERPRDRLYDSANNYLPEVAQEAYAQAVDNILANAGNYTSTVGVQIELEYIDGRWLLIPSQSLMSAITGGAKS